MTVSLSILSTEKSSLRERFPPLIHEVISQSVSERKATLERCKKLKEQPPPPQPETIPFLCAYLYSLPGIDTFLTAIATESELDSPPPSPSSLPEHGPERRAFRSTVSSNDVSDSPACSGPCSLSVADFHWELYREVRLHMYPFKN